MRQYAAFKKKEKEKKVIGERLSHVTLALLEVSGADVVSDRLQWLLASRGTAESLLQPSLKSPSHFLTAEGARAQGRGRGVEEEEEEEEGGDDSQRKSKEKKSSR